MNRFNYAESISRGISTIGGAAATVTTLSRNLAKGNKKQAAHIVQLEQANELASKREKQELDANVDRQVYTEAKEYASATGDDAEKYVNNNRERIQREAEGNINRYGKYAGEISQLRSTAVQDSIYEYRSKNQAPDVKFNPQDLIDGGII